MASNLSLFDLPEFQNALARHLCNAVDGGTGRHWHQPIRKHWCSSCANLPTQSIEKFWVALTTFVHTNMEEVSLDHGDYIA
jgi:hypothetical protein